MNEKLTAYALDELPPHERAELEEQMKSDPALRAEAEEMKAFCTLLSREATDDEAKLTEGQRAGVVQAFAKGIPEQKPVRAFWKRPAFFVPATLAACVAFIAVHQARDSGMFGHEGREASEFVSVMPAKEGAKKKSNLVPARPHPEPSDPQLAQVPSQPVSGPTLQAADGKPQTDGAAPLLAMKDADKSLNETLAAAPTAAGRFMAEQESLNKQPGTAPTSTIRTTPVTGGSASGLKEFGVLGSKTVEAGQPDSLALQMGDRSGLAINTPAPAAPAPTADASSTLARGTVPSASPAPAPGATGKSDAYWFDNGPVIAGVPVQTMEELEQRRGLERQLKEVEDLARREGGFRNRNAAGESYTRIVENPFLFAAQQPLSTFSIDVDTASYANVRRFLNEGQRPPADAVRLEELINYFPYTYEGPSDGKPFGVMVDVAEAPWQPMHRLVRVALKGREVKEDRGTANFVFLVDVSGSMDSPDKLPLVQRSLEMLTRQLGENDRVALVVYAGNSGLVLPSTPGTERETITNAISNLKAGGSTNGASGIQLAYQEAAKHFVKGGVNRVILCTDGDFNVGISSPEELEKLIAEKAKSRIFLSVLGFGTGNLKDRTMETLADKGNGNYAYIDSLSEARKVLVEQMNGTLVTIAKDVKIQVEFNPSQVAAYRLLGYENRLLAKEDFNNDKKDAGEIGAGHTVTALYEVVPANVKFPNGQPLVDELKYAAKPALPKVAEDRAESAPAPASNELLTVKLRYKQPEGDKSDLLAVPVTDNEKKLADSPRDFQFAASVAGFGMLLRGSQHAGELTWDMVRDLALRGKGEDALGYRGEFLQLIDKARGLTEQAPQ